MHFRIADHLAYSRLTVFSFELLIALIGILSIEFSQEILPLSLDFRFTERIIVAGPVKVDNIPLA